MDKTEEVKKILSKFREAVETEDNDFHYEAQLEAERQICQLFEPKTKLDPTPRYDKVFFEGANKMDEQCPRCGAQMIRRGECFRCPKCGLEVCDVG